MINASVYLHMKASTYLHIVAKDMYSDKHNAK